MSAARHGPARPSQAKVNAPPLSESVTPHIRVLSEGIPPVHLPLHIHQAGLGKVEVGVGTRLATSTLVMLAPQPRWFTEGVRLFSMQCSRHCL